MRKAFTLIELAIAMTIVSMLVVALSFRLFGPWQLASIQNDLEKIQAIDEFARRTAIESKTQLAIRFDRGQNEIRVERKADKFLLRKCKVSQSTRLETIRIESAADFPSTSDPVAVVSVLGSTPSYALQVRANNRLRWFVVIGHTGQVLKDIEAKDVDRFFQILQLSK